MGAGSVGKAFLALGSGSAAGYALSLALSPLLTRVFTPEEFGLFGVFGAITAIFSIFASMSLELGIVGARRRGEASWYASAAIGVAVAMCAVSTPVGVLVNRGLGLAMLPDWAVAAAFVLTLVTVLGLVATNWAIRADQPRLAAAGTFVGLVGRSLFQLAGGLTIGGLPGLVAGEIAGRIAGWLVVERGSLRRAIDAMTRKTGRLAGHVRDNVTYAAHVTPAIAVDVALVWLPAPLFAIVYGPAAGGLLALVQRLGSAPLTIANQSLGQLVHRHSAALIERDAGAFVRRIALVALAALPALAALEAFLVLAGGPFMAWLFGEAWRDAGFVAAAFAPLYFVQLLSVATNRIVLVLNRMRLKLALSVAHMLLMLASYPLAGALGLDWTQAMALQAGMLTVSHLGGFALVLFIAARAGHR